jgi:hypothetical protein
VKKLLDWEEVEEEKVAPLIEQAVSSLIDPEPVVSKPKTKKKQKKAVTFADKDLGEDSMSFKNTGYKCAKKERFTMQQLYYKCNEESEEEENEEEYYEEY